MPLLALRMLIDDDGFSALQRAENSSIVACGQRSERRHHVKFQCSSASRKFLNRVEQTRPSRASDVSVLFSEPKIPQSGSTIVRCSNASASFSALQRAENSSIFRRNRRRGKRVAVSVLFSEPKIPQFGSALLPHLTQLVCFSALQRAENSSMDRSSAMSAGSRRFQCSSASRKFLNAPALRSASAPVVVSVLFSEPKIPQFWLNHAQPVKTACFSALQRAENSSMRLLRGGVLRRLAFQCSSASRKFLNPARPRPDARRPRVSVLFSEPKIPQCSALLPHLTQLVGFSALQRAENSSIDARSTIA